MKRWMLLYFLVGGMSLGFAQYGSGSGMGYNRGAQNMPNPTCEGMHLSQQEQAFASQLSPMHRVMFCRHFSVAQRIEAMTLVQTPAENAQGKPITPDESVEIVMKNSRMSSNAPGQNNGQPNGQMPRNPYSNGNNNQQNRYPNY